MEILKGKNLLLADDDQYNIFALMAALEDLEMNITTVVNGREAVDAVMNNPDIDMVLMDIMMPEMDGYEAIGRIRGAGYTDLPIIALTAKAMRADIEKCLEVGASHYMSKPIDVEKLLQAMCEWMQKICSLK